MIKYLPAYAPELNLIEILWRFLQYSWRPFSAYTSFQCLCTAVEDILTRFGTDDKIPFQAAYNMPQFMSGYLGPIRLPAGPWSLRWGLPSLLSTLLDIPRRLSRVRYGGLKRNAVGGVFLTA